VAPRDARRQHPDLDAHGALVEDQLPLGAVHDPVDQPPGDTADDMTGMARGEPPGGTLGADGEGSVLQDPRERFCLRHNPGAGVGL